MKLKIVTPIESAPMAVASSLLPMRPAMAVETIPISGTVMFDMMFGIANRNIALFITRQLCRKVIQIIGMKHNFWHTSCESCEFRKKKLPLPRLIY